VFMRSFALLAGFESTLRAMGEIEGGILYICTTPSSPKGVAGALSVIWFAPRCDALRWAYERRSLYTIDGGGAALPWRRFWGKKGWESFVSGLVVVDR